MLWAIKNVHLLNNGGIHQNRTIVINSDRILDFGSNEVMKRKYNFDTIFDGSYKLALPGLINGHTHFCHGCLRGELDGLSFNSWLQKVNEYRANVKKADIKITTSLLCMELLKSGTLTFVSHQNPRFIEESLEVVRRFKMRGIFAPIVMDRGAIPKELNFTPSKAVSKTKSIEKIAKQIDKKLKILYGPMSLRNCSLDLLKAISEANNEHQLGVHIHACETEEGSREIKRKFGKSEVELLKSLGILKKDATLVHGIHITESDLKIIGEAASSIVHCPTSNSKSGDGVAPVSKMIKMGINVGLGTDGPASNGSQTMFWEMKYVVLLQRIDKKPFPFIEAFRMATLKNARAIGMDKEIGTLERGKKADIILIDLKKPHLFPHKNSLSHIVYGCNGSEVSDAIIDGELVMENRNVLGIDEGRIIDEAMEYFAQRC
jgi:5-methylthioadenosine/S-adenosylhomocysteine deaminase